eukprot:UN18479
MTICLKNDVVRNHRKINNIIIQNIMLNLIDKCLLVLQQVT